jgi:hypothetical protein
MPKLFTILFAAAIIAKTALLFFFLPYFENTFPGQYQLRNTPDKYAAIAANVAAGNGYRTSPETAPTMTREPGFVLFLSMLFLTAGQSLWVINVANLFFSILTAYVLLLIAKELEFPPMAVYLTPLFYLLHPAIIISESRAGFEIFFILLIASSLYMMIKLQKTENIKYAVFGGILLGYAVITRSTALVFSLLAAAYLFYSSKISINKRIFNTIVFLTILFIPLTAWTIRNYNISGSLVMTNTVVGDVLFQGMFVEMNKTNENYYQTVRKAARIQGEVNEKLGIPYKKGFFEEYYDPKDEVAHSKEMKSIVFSTYRENPSLLLGAMGNNFFRFWFQGRTQKSTMVNIVFITPLLLLALFGMILTLREKKPVGLPLLYIGTLILAHLPIIALCRHHVPLIPVFALFQGLAFAKILNSWKVVSPVPILKGSNSPKSGVKGGVGPYPVGCDDTPTEPHQKHGNEAAPLAGCGNSPRHSPSHREHDPA